MSKPGRKRPDEKSRDEAAGGPRPELAVLWNRFLQGLSPLRVLAVFSQRDEWESNPPAPAIPSGLESPPTADIRRRGSHLCWCSMKLLIFSRPGSHAQQPRGATTSLLGYQSTSNPSTAARARSQLRSGSPNDSAVAAMIRSGISGTRERDTCSRASTTARLSEASP
jgi:hypothetical protein